MTGIPEIGDVVMVRAVVRSVHAQGGEPWFTLEGGHDDTRFAAPLSDIAIEAEFRAATP